MISAVFCDISLQLKGFIGNGAANTKTIMAMSPSTVHKKAATLLSLRIESLYIWVSIKELLSPFRRLTELLIIHFSVTSSSSDSLKTKRNVDVFYLVWQESKPNNVVSIQLTWHIFGYVTKI